MGNAMAVLMAKAVLTLFDAKRRVGIPQDREWVSSYGCYLNRGTELECTYEVESDVLFREGRGKEWALFYPIYLA